MLSNYYTLAHLATLLDSRLKGKQIQSVFSQEKAQLVIEVSGGHSVVISCQPRLNALYLHPRFIRARKNTTDLFPSCPGKEITGVAIHPSDRIVIITLETSERIEASFFGSTSNIVLLGSDNLIIDSFKKKEGTRAKTDRPPGKNDPDITVMTSLRQSFPLLGPTLVREVATRASIAPGTLWRELRESDKMSLGRFLAQVQEELTTPRPRIYFPHNESPEFSIIPLRQFAGEKEEHFENLNDGIRTFLGRMHTATGREDRRGLLEKQLTTMHEKTVRTSAAMEREHSGTERPGDYERMGKLILANIVNIGHGRNEATLSGEHGPVTIALHPGLSPAANAQRYFEKAKRSREARKQIEERLASMRDRVELLSLLVREISSSADIDTFLEARSGELKTLGISKDPTKEKEVPFRVFQVEGGFEVWAGKNSKSNDELTMRHARPNDLWFHARGSGGSHVVLRVGSAKGEPGKKARTQAASIAAYFSKMKNSKMVPVAVTLRKHVRKPRGSPAGTVAIEREEVLIVEPRLPEVKS